MSLQERIPAEGPLRGLESEFELVRELGRGGSAVVYLAVERELGREVAIKTIHPLFASDPEALARLVREARTLARLQHPNIVTFYGVRRLADGGLAVVMQYVRGERLKDRIRARGRLDVEEARRILVDTARALAHAHRHRVVHRDIKPENIYLDAELGIARLSDFGIARAWDHDGSLTQAGLAIGTPAYMAPEQIDGVPLDGRSDLYSLGLVGHEMLTGERPWAGQNLYGIIYRQKHEALPSLAGIRPDVPEPLRAVIERALEKDPDRRWPSADTMLVALSGPNATASLDGMDRPEGTGSSPSGDGADAVTARDRRSPATAAATWGGPARGTDPGDDAPTVAYRAADAAPSPDVAAALLRAQMEGPTGSFAEDDDGVDVTGAALLPEPRSSRSVREPDGARRRKLALGMVALLATATGALALLRLELHPSARPDTPPPPRESTQASAASASPPRATAGRRESAGAVAGPGTVAMQLGSRPETPRRERHPMPPPPRIREEAAPEGGAVGAPPSAAPDVPAASETEGLPRQRPALLGQPVAAPAADAATQSATGRPPLASGAPVATPPQAAGPAPTPGPSAAARPAQRVDDGAPPAGTADAPAFTPFTVAPQLMNQAEVQRAMSRYYPPMLRDAGVGGRVVVWLYVDEEGTVRKAEVHESSGNVELDRAAARIGAQMRFSPALNRDQRVAVWVSLPIVFSGR